LKAFEELGLKVGKTVGDFDAPEVELKKMDIIVATSERADSLMRHKTDWMHDIGVVIADEVHLMNDHRRGPTLEVTLVRLKELNPSIQFIALSATISNSNELAEWMEAEHVYSDWRPVVLKEGILLDETITFNDNTTKEVREHKDPLISLVLDTVKDQGQAMVFVNSRRSSEAVAERVGKALAKVLTEDELEATGELAKEFTASEEEPTTVGARLSRCIEQGSAFHNAGLTEIQRRLIESNFRSGLIKSVSATPTLAAGINLPARRVIVRDLRRYDANYGSVPIPVLEVKQMCGRAGRPQYDPYGEAILMAKNPGDASQINDNYLLAETEAIRSKLGSEPALRTHILATIATGYARDREALMGFFDKTFYAHQMDVWTIEGMVDSMVEFLEKSEMLSFDEGGIKATLFGSRTSDLYIDPLSAIILKNALDMSESKSTNSLCLLQACCSTPDMPQLYLRKKDGDWIEDLANENTEQFLMDLPIEGSGEMEYFLSALKTAHLLMQWMDEVPENDIVFKFGVGPGDIRARVDNGEWLLYSMREIARLFGSPSIGLLNPLVLRIRYGIKEELLPLVKLSNIGRKRARTLFDSGYEAPADITKAKSHDLESLPGIGKQLAAGMIEQSKKIR